MKDLFSCIKKIVPYILIIFGSAIIIITLYQRLSVIYYQAQYVQEYEKHISKIDQQNIPDENQTQEENTIIEEIQLPETLINPDDVKNNSPDYNKEQSKIIGILEIPKINVNVAILEGTDDRALKYTVGYYPQTALPGEKGNMVLLGHRNYVYGRFFNKLDKLEIGDSIIVKRDNNTYTYNVTESFVVTPKDTWVLNQTSDAQITMITCTPIGTYTHRLIVKGVLIN